MRHKWKYSPKVWSRRCMTCGLRQYYKKRKSARGVSGYTMDLVSTMPDGTKVVGDKVSPCVGRGRL